MSDLNSTYSTTTTTTIIYTRQYHTTTTTDYHYNYDSSPVHRMTYPTLSITERSAAAAALIAEPLPVWHNDSWFVNPAHVGMYVRERDGINQCCSG